MFSSRHTQNITFFYDHLNNKKKQTMSSALFIDKHKPIKSSGIAGQDFAVRDLTSWLKSWNGYIQAPANQRRPDFRRAYMLAGPPGIGKSLMVDLVCAECGITNALRLDSLCKRTKKELQVVKDAFTTRNVGAYMTGMMQRSKVGAVIVDDIDVMIGGGDVGGVPEIVSFIKKTCVPVICVCNDASHKSLRTLAGLCKVMRMQRPQPNAIFAHLSYINHAEKLGLPPKALQDIVAATGCDVRQAVNELQFCSRMDKGRSCNNSSNSSTTSTSVGNFATVGLSDSSGITMDRVFGPFDIISMMFRRPPVPISTSASIRPPTRYQQPQLPQQQRPKSLIHLADLGIDADSMLVPCLVAENYLSTKQDDLAKLADAADAISAGDHIDWACRRGSLYGISSDVRAAVSIALPCQIIGEPLCCRPAFPSSLGKGSTCTKNKSLLGSISHKSLPMVSRDELAMQHIGYMHKLWVCPMAAFVHGKPETKGRVEAIAREMESVGRSKADWDVVFELGHCGLPATAIHAQVKGALTRSFGMVSKKSTASKKRSLTGKDKRVTAAPAPPKKSARKEEQPPSDCSDDEDGDGEEEEWQIQE